MKSIAIVDKYPIIRTGLREFVTQHFSGTVIVEADNLSQYLINKAGAIPDVIIVGNTAELFNSICQSIVDIKKRSHNSQVIIFDEAPDYVKIVRSFKAGAKGYLTKLSDMQELYKCVSKACEGRIYICHDALGLILPDYHSTEKGSGKDRMWLSPREYDVANLLLSGESVTLIGKRMEIKVATVRAIKGRIFKKLNITKIIDLKDSLKTHLDRQDSMLSDNWKTSGRKEYM
nr:response regulator transcription factor [uncultured Dyadobacter sp.]